MGTRRLSQKQIEIARDLHNHVEGQATLAVMKSALLLTAHAFLCAAYIQVALSIKIFEHWTYDWADILFIDSGVIILCALLASLKAIWPKMESTEENKLLFFAGIGEYPTADEYVTAYRKVSDEVLVLMLLSNVYGKSEWLRKTFWFIRLAISFSAIGTLLCVVSVCFLSLPPSPQPQPQPQLHRNVKETFRRIDTTPVTADQETSAISSTF
ncbi:Pycsar system effector family protein [Pseudomonas sp. UMAB-40]|uniref:Pycsar system effector family protein n=1 Tax=Pseudomonas sp. UMAB-40 TaxID=1365407 RepID=UPI001C5A4134|nr:Pycsar system effector family protein [Pseudomonas sp. UMAB-40]